MSIPEWLQLAALILIAAGLALAAAVAVPVAGLNLATGLAAFGGLLLAAAALLEHNGKGVR